ncbi:response regulator [Methylobacterium oxalidis]|uniref:DNA-binding response regulator n=1 Tax=Methylobacterium oxalidis TaxID=944322 RepID=A0A512JCM6_9HYPH|nr:response regulator transcription factor [Methylobacterium oxalidis]GEP07669.1 DNA-binding response regulator [Methylobacterium oxalidis]GJE34009.1 Transcriptional regulatory protein DegU [Methylobacterium oxalidis]GLS65995.1 DNA-binding response regulator [Methylobacterium oxalidis]
MTDTKVALVADDDEFFRMALRAILQNRLGFAEVIETGSLDEAIEHLGRREDIALALFDLAMPGMQGAGSLRAVREVRPETLTAIVSASKRRQDILQALEAGGHGYIPKGIGVAELGQALEMILKGFIYVPPLLADISSGPCHEPSPPPAPADATLPTSFTPRQREVLELIVQGKSNKEIARALSLGEGTVKIHVAALFRTLGVSSRSAAAAIGGRVLNSAPSA